jgi:hypothetical protein
MGDSGVVDVVFGDSPRQMLSNGLRRHPGMGLFPDRGDHAEWVAAVVARIESGSRAAAVRARFDAVSRYLSAS